MTPTLLCRRLAGIVPTLLLTWSLVFGALQLIPGDPVTLMLGGTPASQEVIEAERARLGLDRSVAVQYASFLARAVVADFGESFRTRQPVAGMILIQVFATGLGWVPVLGTGPVALILPSITVGLYLAGSLARLVRGSVIEVAGQDYIRTARAKGLQPVWVVVRRIGRNAVIPPLNLLGTQFALLIGGAVVTECVFARSGLGVMLVEAVLSKDYPLVQGIVVVLTGADIVINLLTDILSGWLDPHSRCCPTPRRSTARTTPA